MTRCFSHIKIEWQIRVFLICRVRVVCGVRVVVCGVRVVVCGVQGIDCGVRGIDCGV